VRENTGTTYGFRQSRLDLRREVAVVSVALRNDDIAVGTARESPRKLAVPRTVTLTNVSFVKLTACQRQLSSTQRRRRHARKNYVDIRPMAKQFSGMCLTGRRPRIRSRKGTVFLISGATEAGDRRGNYGATQGTSERTIEHTTH